MMSWQPPAKIEEIYAATSDNIFSKINSPHAGARTEEPVPTGNAPFQLYSLATPNGQKIGVLLEELGIEYDAHVIRLDGSQFKSGFVEINPNSKIPCGVDYAPTDGAGPIRLFESASMMLYLAEKHRRFLPSIANPRMRAECINWVMWQMAGQGPMTGNFGHFMVYAPPAQVDARNYGVARYGMEVQRLCSVLDTHLADGRKYLCGEEYTVADMACLPWFQLVRSDLGYQHTNGVRARDFLSILNYKHACSWADRLMARPQVQRGMLVCRKYGKPWLNDKRFTHLTAKL
jgi:GST-like protein